MELLAFDRGSLDHAPFGVGETVEPGREEGLHARWDGDVGEVRRRDPSALALLQRAVVDQHRHHLLDEQRIALCGLRDAAPHGLLELRGAEEVLDEFLALRFAQRLEQDRRRVELPAAPPGANVQKLWTRRTHQEDR